MKRKNKTKNIQISDKIESGILILWVPFFLSVFISCKMKTSLTIIFPYYHFILKMSFLFLILLANDLNFEPP